jgi:hypothetical protein
MVQNPIECRIIGVVGDHCRTVLRSPLWIVMESNRIECCLFVQQQRDEKKTIIIRNDLSVCLESKQPNPIQFNPIQFNSIQSNPIQSNPIQSNSIQNNSIQFNPRHVGVQYVCMYVCMYICVLRNQSSYRCYQNVRTCFDGDKDVVVVLPANVGHHRQQQQQPRSFEQQRRQHRYLRMPAVRNRTRNRNHRFGFPIQGWESIETRVASML